MTSRIPFILAAAIALGVMSSAARAESKKEYQNRVKLMLDFAVHSNEYVRQRLGDRSLVAYAHAMAERNAGEAERMTPPKPYTMLHPHFLLVLENIERAFFYAKSGDLGHYRKHQKVVRQELQLLETLAEREHLELYMWGIGR